MRARLRVGRDAAGVVVHVGGNQAGTHHREQQRETMPQTADALLQVRAAGADGGNLSEMALQSMGCFTIPFLQTF